MNELSTAYYDGVIALVVSAVPLYFLELRRRWARIASRGPHAAAVFALTIIWATVAYGSFIEPRLLAVREYPVSIGVSGRRLRIAVVGDLHLGYYRHRDWVEKVVKNVNALEPDVIILTGDFVSNAAGIEGLAPLKNLRSRFGSFAVLGNHDYRIGAVDVRKAIEGYTVEVLTNESVALDLGGKTVRLIGLDDVTYGAPSWMSALKEVGPDDATILAVHNPDATREAEVRGLDLVLAGHTHCGQVRLPFVGPVPQLPTTLGREFDCGLFTFGPTQLFITRGVGETGARARLFNRPEVSVLNVEL